MKISVTLALLFVALPLSANTWSYQVTINDAAGVPKVLDAGKNSFEAGAYFCEVTPVTVNNATEYRSLVCAVGAGTVSTGGLCTRKNHKFPSVQFAILNLNGPKNLVSVVVSCKFD
jgi:hypothetical protein